MADPLSPWQVAPTQEPSQPVINNVSRHLSTPIQGSASQLRPTSQNNGIPMADTARTQPTDASPLQQMTDPARTQTTDASSLRATVSRLQRDLRDLRERCTVVMQENVQLKQQVIDKTNEVKILVVQNTVHQRTIDELKTAAQTTRGRNEGPADSRGGYSLVPCKRRKHKPNCVGAGIKDTKVLNFLRTISKDVDGLATLESMELTSQSPPVRQWLCRGHMSMRSAPNDPPVRVLQCAYEPYPISAANTYYHPTAGDGTITILRDRAVQLITEEPWRSITPPEGGMDIFVTAVVEDSVLHNMFNKIISQRHSYRRQKMRQMFFNALGYTTFLLGNDKSTQASSTTAADTTVRPEATVDPDEDTRSAEVREVCDKFFPAGLDSFPDMSTWRTQPESFLSFEGDGTRRTGPITELYEDNTCTDKLYVTALSRTCVREFLGYNPGDDSTQPTDMSLVTLAQVDVWVVSSVWILAKGQQKQGRLTQKIYQNAYDRFIGPAVTQLMGSLYSYVRSVSPEAVISIPVQASWLRNNDNQGSNISVTDIVDSPEGHSFLRITPLWIRRNLSTTVGLMQDAFISKAEQTDAAFTVYEFLQSP